MKGAGSYYNENDPFKAEVLRIAIRHHAIADGVVDDRSIVDVTAGDVRGFTQCHFFAGGGFWSVALRQAGWPDDRPVWTGSCPCPGFSTAGRREGFSDPRHLWPHWMRLIRKCRPPKIFGEQSDDAIGFGWLDLVQTDLEGEAYAIGKAVLGACSAGGADLRQRLYFVAHADAQRCQRRWPARAHNHARQQPERLRTAGIMGNAIQPGLEGHAGNGDDCDEPRWFRAQTAGPAAATGASGNAGTLKGYWRDADWLYCTDGKWRPVEPGTFPLAYGVTARVGRIRMYGDAINVEVAKAFIEACSAIGA